MISEWREWRKICGLVSAVLQRDRDPALMQYTSPIAWTILSAWRTGQRAARATRRDFTSAGNSGRRRHPRPADRPRRASCLAPACRRTQFRRQAVDRTHRPRCSISTSSMSVHTPAATRGSPRWCRNPGADNWNGPYLKGDALPMDPWNHPYVYRNPSERTGHDYRPLLAGPDGNASQGGAICNP